MLYRIINHEGRETGGTDQLDDIAKAAALLEAGHIVDENGEMVYESPAAVARREHEKVITEQKAQADAQQAALEAEQ